MDAVYGRRGGIGEEGSSCSCKQIDWQVCFLKKRACMQAGSSYWRVNSCALHKEVTGEGIPPRPMGCSRCKIELCKQDAQIALHIILLRVGLSEMPIQKTRICSSLNIQQRKASLNIFSLVASQTVKLIFTHPDAILLVPMAPRTNSRYPLRSWGGGRGQTGSTQRQPQTLHLLPRSVTLASSFQIWNSRTEAHPSCGG
eukprot:1145940-Pelagomonas_calceolata.AAC.1